MQQAPIALSVTYEKIILTITANPDWSTLKLFEELRQQPEFRGIAQEKWDSLALFSVPDPPSAMSLIQPGWTLSTLFAGERGKFHLKLINMRFRLRVALMDESTKTVSIIGTSTIGHVVAHLCNLLHIADPSGYYLSAGQKIFLDPEQRLFEVGISEDNNEVMFKKRFITVDSNVVRIEPNEIAEQFAQCKHRILTCNPVAYTDAVSLAALQLQEELGDFKPSPTWSKEILQPRLERLFHSSHLKSTNSQQIERDVVGSYKKCCGMKKANVHFRFVQLCRSLRLWDPAENNSKG